VASYLAELYKAIADARPFDTYWTLRLPDEQASQSATQVWPCVVGRVFGATPQASLCEFRDFDVEFIFSIFSRDLSGVELIDIHDQILEKFHEGLKLETPHCNVTFMFSSVEFVYSEELYQADLSFSLTVTRRI
jgi:hypothetical protein